MHRAGSVVALTVTNCWRIAQVEVQAAGISSPEIDVVWADASGTLSWYFNECRQRHTECEKSKGGYEFLKEHDLVNGVV